MKKIIPIEIDCAVCAQKCQEAISKVDGVNECTINFITQKMTLDIAEEDEKILKAVKKAARKIEPDFEMEL